MLIRNSKKTILIATIGLLLVGSGLLFLSVLPPSAMGQARQQTQTNAQKDNVVRKAFTDRFGGGGRGQASNTKLLIVAGCVVAAITVTLVLVGRYHKSRNTKDGYYSRNELFRDLCRTHEFTNYQQTLLKSIAKELQLKNPAVLFIEPKHLELALVEPVVPYPQEAIRQIFKELFSSENVSSGLQEEEQNSWFAWTHITTNPEAEQLKKRPQKDQPQENVSDSSDSPVEPPPTQQWDPSLWDNVQRAAKGLSLNPEDAKPHAVEGMSQVPVYQSPPLRKEVEERENSAYHYANQKTASVSFAVPPSSEPEQSVPERTGYKPKYPETQDAAIHQAASGEIRSIIGEKPVKPSPPSVGPGAQILSSLIHSVSDVSNDLAFSSIRNHLTRSLSLSPQTFGEIKPSGLKHSPETDSTNSTLAVPLDEILVSTKPQAAHTQTQTQIELKTQPKIVVKPIELKATDLKPHIERIADAISMNVSQQRRKSIE